MLVAGNAEMEKTFKAFIVEKAFRTFVCFPETWLWELEVDINSSYSLTPLMLKSSPNHPVTTGLLTLVDFYSMAGNNAL